MGEPDPPAIVLVTDGSAESVRRTFGRYEHEYRIEQADCLSSSLPLVQRLLAAQVRIAMIVVEYALPDATGLITLDCLQALSPTSKRVLMVPWDDYQLAREESRTARSTNRIDLSVMVPRGPRDEELHLSLVDLLSDWGWTSGPPLVSMVRIVTPEPDPASIRIADFLDRQGIPHQRVTPTAVTGAEVLAELGDVDGEVDYPLVKVERYPVLVRPGLGELAELVSKQDELSDEVYDLAIVGGGPAGLGAAVYGASEGLRTVVLDADAIGGQAGTSSMIRNYLGFPNGISGMRLTQRARFQAGRFGARLQSAIPVQRLELTASDQEPHVLHTSRVSVRARSVVIATGVKYRRLGIEALEDLVGMGVHYGAAAGAAREYAGQDVVVVGGGNSAGQAAVHLARFARSVTILVRRPDLSATMSDYLIREIAASPRITVRGNAEIVDGGGPGRLAWLKICDNRDRTVSKLAAGGLFLLLGAKPHCDWLPDEIARDEHGFVLTGREIAKTDWSGGVPPPELATTVPGVFAVGDVRRGSMKRVASASGEGSAVVPLVHAYLSSLRTVPARND